MKIDINEENLIRLKEVFEPIELVAASEQRLTICMRDNGFEIATEGACYSTSGGDLVRMDAKDGTEQEWIAIPIKDYMDIVNHLLRGYNPLVQYSEDQRINSSNCISIMRGNIHAALKKLRGLSPSLFDLPT